MDRLIIQFLGNVLSALIAVQITSLLQGGYWQRVFAVTYLGLLTCCAVNSMYWNWYVFSTGIFITQILDMVVGFFLAGLVICSILPGAKAWIGKPRRGEAEASKKSGA